MTSRRSFLKAATTGATALALGPTAYGRVRGANERISIGVIGCGQRGYDKHMPGVHDHAESENVEITAVCDPWSVHLERASKRAEEWSGRPVRKCVSYRSVLDLGDVDAVMIASCDHQHTTHLEAAARAKKDVYCEKPLGMDLGKLKSACAAVRSAGVVFQAGTQLRSYPSFTGCQKLFRSGALGGVSRIEQCRNSPQPYWYSRLRDVQASDVDWGEFLLDRPARPFRADVFSGWYGYREFSDGPIPGLGSHFLDLIHYITGAKFPESAVAQGGTFTWDDEHGFTCPDHCQAVWTYPQGFLVSYSTNFGNGDGNSFRMYGEHGVLNMLPWDKPTVSGAGAIRKGSLGDVVPVEHVEKPDHFLDWLRCLRSRNTPNADIEAGYQHAVAAILAIRALDTGRRQVYDVDTAEIREG